MTWIVGDENLSDVIERLRMRGFLARCLCAVHQAGPEIENILTAA
jgi:hypothetical protein